MSSNKAVQRYRLLDKCFRDTTREYTSADLLDAVNRGLSELSNPHSIGERQLYADIAYMRSEDGLKAEIDTYRVVRPDENGRNRTFVAYRYHDPKFSIDHMPLTHKQMSYIESAIESFGFISGIPQVAWLQNSVMGVRTKFEINNQPCVRFSGNPFLGGSRANEVYDNFEQLFTAMRNQQSVTVHYCSFEHEPSVFSFHPVYMKQFHEFWYVYGVTTDAPKTIQTLALDRIDRIDPCNDKYIHSDFDPDTYFADIVGVVDTGGEAEDVHVMVYGWAGRYMENCPLHGSQRSKWMEVDGEKVLDVHLHVKINTELISMLMFYGACIKVLSPMSLVEEYRTSLRKAIALNE